jgi:hypothetical protein
MKALSYDYVTMKPTLKSQEKSSFWQKMPLEAYEGFEGSSRGMGKIPREVNGRSTVFSFHVS